MTRPFRHLPWMRYPAWRMTHPPYEECTETEDIPAKNRTENIPEEILNEPVSTLFAGLTLGILAVACAILFSLAWLGKLP